MMKTRLLGYLLFAGLLAFGVLSIWPAQHAAGQDATSCTFTATTNNVVLRSGPGREYTELSRINSGQSLTITGRDVGLDLYVWWQTANDEWVRSDLGDSDCPSLCGDGICEYGETADGCSSDCTGSGASLGASITGLNCVVADCESCYETIDCYPNCNNCSCESNEYGCPTCYCDYGAGGTATTTGTGGGGVVTTYADISCTFSPKRDINLRSGPGTSYEVVGEALPDQSVAIKARDVGADGYVWWKTTNDEWVRSDLGTTDCPNLCGDGVCEIDETASTCAADCGSATSSSGSATSCTVADCESCYETVDCYPNCGNCTCSTNEFGCPECYCTY